MNYFIITIFISSFLMLNGCSDKLMVKCSDNNYMSKKISIQKITTKIEEN